MNQYEQSLMFIFACGIVVNTYQIKLDNAFLNIVIKFNRNVIIITINIWQ